MRLDILNGSYRLCDCIDSNHFSQFFVNFFGRKRGFYTHI